MTGRHFLLPALASALTLAALASCGDTQSGVSQQQPEDTHESAVTEAETEVKQIDIIGGLGDLDFGGAELNIDISVNSQEWLTSSVYQMGPAEETGDIIQDMVFRRNKEIEEALNVGVNWKEIDLNYDAVASYIKKQVMAGDDIVDLYLNDQFGFITCMVNGYFKNLEHTETYQSYFDFSADGWNDAYMKKLSLIDGRRYFLVGSYFMDTLRSAHVIYFNRNIMADLYEGADELYNLVEAGQWTFAKYLEYTENTYSDLNGNGKVDTEDRFGTFFYDGWSVLFHSISDARLVSWEKGYPTVDIDMERNVKAMELFDRIVSSDGDYPDNANGDDVIPVFLTGRLLMTGWRKIADIEREEMRNMEGIGIIPYPKLDEQQKNYQTIIHDTTEIGAIPVTSTDEKTSIVSAYLQAQTQYTTEYILPAYYETALKIKYSQDEQSARMLDIIRRGITDPFDYAYSSYLGGIPFLTGKNYASSVEKKLKTAEDKLQKLLDTVTALE